MSQTRDLLAMHEKSGALIAQLQEQYRAQQLQRYKDEGCIPWSEGYEIAHGMAVNATLFSDRLMQIFADDMAPLPEGHGLNLDERLVEWPWVITHLPPRGHRILDAGSALNHPHVLAHPVWKDKKLDILTLAPEGYCEWHKGISYLFGDLRDTPYKDQLFDTIVSISTLEHIGMNNEQYGGEKNEQATNDIFNAFRELHRILKPGGGLLFSVPFGLYQNLGWFQQFDGDLLDRCAAEFDPMSRRDIFFRYTTHGWVRATREECKGLHYQEAHKENPYHDNAAAARSVACCQWHKKL